MARRQLPVLVVLLVVASTVLAGCLGGDDASLGGQSADGDVAPASNLSEMVAPAPGFAPPIPVDPMRAGGEPVILVHPDGTIVLSAHAGTTHLRGQPGADFLLPYTGQSFIWRSTDGGTTWDYVGLPGVDAGPHGTSHGFSDPDLAIDAAGNLYHTELYLLQASVSKSTDAGRTWLQGNPAASHVPIVDRQWVAADEEDEVYLSFNQLPLGHMVLRSTDGGLTFPQVTQVDGGATKLYVDKADGSVYDVAGVEGGFDLMASRDEAATFDRFEIVRDRPVTGIFADLAIDDASHLYLTWTEEGPGNGSSIWLASSTDRGETWGEPVQVSNGIGTSIWPWVVAGSEGRVFVTWLATDEAGDPQEVAHDAPWRVMVAQSLNAHEDSPLFTRTAATELPVHEGPICQGGTGCQVTGGDRRLGDFFSATLDGEGRLLIAVPSTRSGDAISHPLFLKQVEGASGLATVGTLDGSWT